MHSKYLLLFLSLLTTVAHAQVTDTSKLSTINLNEFVISGNKFEENKKNISQPIQVIGQKEIEWTMPQTAAVLLEQSGNVFVQKSQMGGGSPVVRGFEASRVLLVIDGVRMNNAIYRAGHLQNAITVDPNLLDRVEILYGPASTLYGSDALGGVIIFNTKQPMLGLNGKTKIAANTMTRYSSAYSEYTGHFDFNIGFKKFASLTSVSYSSFGDLRQGNNRNPFYGSFGMRKEYVERINGVDSILQNNDSNIQKQSGYDQIDILEKMLFRQNDHVTHTLNLQYSTSSDIPRYDRLTDVRNGKLRFAEWYYGPQKRLMAAYQFNAKNMSGFFNDVRAGLSYQAIEESRIQRDRGKNDRQSRIESVGVTAYNLDVRKLFGRHELTIGTDGQYNKVNSTAHATDITTGLESPIDTRYPNGGSNMFYGAIYAQHFFKIIEDKLILNDGIRLNYVSLKSRFDDTTFFPFPYREATQSNVAWSGNLGLVYMPAPRWRFALNGSTGFRSPNVDDIAKVFESAGGEQLVVPNPNLRPEYTYNLDLGITYVVTDRVKVEATGFYTWFKNAIVMDRFQLNGQDSVLYGGSMTAVVANQNKARAYLYGFNASITAELFSNVTFYSTINHVYGRYFDQNEQRFPLDHIPPTFGKTSLRYTPGKFNAEFFVLYNGWKRIEEYNPFGEDNQQYATVHGMPAWYTLNLRAGYRLNRHFGLEMALENLLDYNYRAFASGISAPGRNFVLTLRGSL
jgi:hemoglobin/transferrin/lactoferrin receptor protein